MLTRNTLFKDPLGILAEHTAFQGIPKSKKLGNFSPVIQWPERSTLAGTVRPSEALGVNFASNSTLSQSWPASFQPPSAKIPSQSSNAKSMRQMGTDPKKPTRLYPKLAKSQPGRKAGLVDVQDGGLVRSTCCLPSAEGGISSPQMLRYDVHT